MEVPNGWVQVLRVSSSEMAKGGIEGIQCNSAARASVWAKVGRLTSAEILADGLPLFGGAQLAVDTTLMSPLHCDGSPHPHANVDGLSWPWCGAGKREPTQNLCILGAEHDWWFCPRGWRQMVGGDQKFPLHPRQGQSEVRTPHLAQECGASMAHAVGCSVWLCSSSCVRCLLVGVETRRRSGRRRPRHQRGGERLSPRRFDVSKGGVRT